MTKNYTGVWKRIEKELKKIEKELKTIWQRITLEFEKELKKNWKSKVEMCTMYNIVYYINS